MYQSIPFGVDEDGKQVNVILMDANHCPGAVMVLFEGAFGRVLHTGDFRYSSCLGKSLKSCLGKNTCLDLAFVDNTYILSDRSILTLEMTVRRVGSTYDHDRGQVQVCDRICQVA